MAKEYDDASISLTLRDADDLWQHMRDTHYLIIDLMNAVPEEAQGRLELRFKQHLDDICGLRLKLSDAVRSTGGAEGKRLSKTWVKQHDRDLVEYRRKLDISDVVLIDAYRAPKDGERE